MRQNEQNMVGLFSALAASCASEVIRRADAAGNVPRQATFDIQQAVGERIAAFFLGRDGSGARNPFVVLPDGSVMPLSPYMRALWSSIQVATRIPVEQHATIMQRRLPPDLLVIMRGAHGNPFQRARAMVREQIFRPNPLARYDPAHLWVDPNGYQLSDRIWNTTAATRQRLNLFLDDAIRQGRGVLNLEDRGATGIARDLEQFLIPGRSLRTTNKPYGIDASYDAMRLARTEITRAHARAAELSATMNPFVEGIAVRLSGSHSNVDICDEAAAAGPWPKDAIPFEYQIPLHPHCLCSYQYAMIGDPQAQLDRLRDDIRSARRELVDLVGPLLVEQFTQMLLNGGGLEVNRALPELLAA